MAPSSLVVATINPYGTWMPFEKGPSTSSQIASAVAAFLLILGATSMGRGVRDPNHATVAERFRCSEPFNCIPGSSYAEYWLTGALPAQTSVRAVRAQDVRRDRVWA